MASPSYPLKRLLIATAVIELGPGVGLLCWPSAVVALLLGTPLDTVATLALGRLAGAALLTLALACWLARDHGQNPAARGVVVAMTLYNLGAVIVLGAAALQLPAHGLALRAVVALHAAMGAWCVVSLRGKVAAHVQ